MMADARGPVLVLLPGMHGTAALFAPLRERLPPSQRVLAIEYPPEPVGSYAAIVEWTSRRLPAEELVILGESFSGPIAIELAATHSRVRGLILAATFLRAPVPRPLAGLAGVAGKAALRLGVPAALSIAGLLGSHASTALAADVRAAIRGVPRAVLASRLGAVMAADVRAIFAATTAPVLLMTGTRDRVVPSWCMEEATSLRRDASLCRVEGAPHLLLQTHPAAAADSLATFLSRLSAR